MTDEQVIKEIISILNLNANTLGELNTDKEKLNQSYDTFKKLADLLINYKFME